MHTIHCHFQRIPDVLAVDLLDAWGVYVLWDGRAKARPAYIGEGDVWRRFIEHRGWTTRPFDGYVAVVDETHTKSMKRDIQIVEALLLWIAGETDRTPSQNAKGGNVSNLYQLFRAHGVVKVFVDGFDPLQDPITSKVLLHKKIASIRWNTDGDFEVEHDWRLRRRT